VTPNPGRQQHNLLLELLILGLEPAHPAGQFEVLPVESIELLIFLSEQGSYLAQACLRPG
jgi:hypothetical protein